MSAGGNIYTRDIKNSFNAGNVTILSPVEQKDLHDSLVNFQKEITKINLPTGKSATVNGDLAAAIDETEQEKPNNEKVQSRFQSAIDTIKSALGTTEPISKWEWTEKIVNLLLKIGLKIIV
jgi:hypothetical protein